MKEHHRQLLALLNTQYPVSVQDLAQKLYVSESSIRRYLSELAEEGQIIRTSKGARLLTTTVSEEIGFLYRENQNIREKKIIAEQVLPYLHDNQMIMMDDSSTVLYLVPYSSRYKDLLVVTNSIRIQYALCEQNILTYCLGGLTELPGKYSAVGHQTEDALSSFYGHLAVFSCKGLSIEGIATSNSCHQDYLRQIMMKNCEKSLLLIDSFKIGHIYTHKCVDVADVDNVLSDKPLPDSIRSRIGIRKHHKQPTNQYHKD